MTDPRYLNTFCPGCEQENALFAREENDMIVTSCRNCGDVMIRPFRRSPNVDHSRKLLDKDSCRGVAS